MVYLRSSRSAPKPCQSLGKGRGGYPLGHLPHTAVPTGGVLSTSFVALGSRVFRVEGFRSLGLAARGRESIGVYLECPL